MKISTILGTRPEIIRLSKIITLLDELLGGRHQVFHTGQNFTPELDTNLFEEFGLRAPDVHAVAGGGTFSEQLAIFLPKLEAWLKEFRPDRFLVLGDTNSSLGALIAARLGIPVYHLEAGNRCHGKESPEEINRRVIDHISTVNLCYSDRARMNLVAEGIPLARTFVVGNPLAEVLAANRRVYSQEDGGRQHVDNFQGWERIGWHSGQKRFLATLHRAENVDDPDRLLAFLGAIDGLCADVNAMCLMSTHPRTRSRIAGREWKRLHIVFSDPLPFREFIAFEGSADFILSDSGTAPEECAIMEKPLMILRGYMERQELLERGVGVLWAPGPLCSIRLAYEAAILSMDSRAALPPGYEPRPVAATVARLLLSPVPPY